MTIFYDDKFIEIDLLLRRGGHINRSNLASYDYVCQNFEELQKFYGRYSCSLYQHPDGFFYMAVKGGMFRTRLLPKSCVHLGIFISLKARDPEITRSSGRVPINQLFQDIETSVPREVLQQVYAPNRREAIVDECILDEIKKALKILADLGFIEMTESTIRPLEAINRFAELARYNNEPNEESRSNLTAQRGVVFSDADENDDESEGTTYEH
jgi:chromosome condensin MukBEF MukE localization factor